jgi:hypothetical protein
LYHNKEWKLNHNRAKRAPKHNQGSRGLQYLPKLAAIKV